MFHVTTRSRGVFMAAAVAALLGGAALLSVSPAPALAEHHPCGTGEFCLYFNDDANGGYYYFEGSDPDLNDDLYEGGDLGETVGDTARYVWNNGVRAEESDVIVYGLPNYEGPADCIRRGEHGTLPRNWWNNIESYRWVTRTECASAGLMFDSETPPSDEENIRCGSATEYQELRINDGQRLRLEASGIEERYGEDTTQTPPQQYPHSTVRHPAGETTLELASCKPRTGPWRLVRAGLSSSIKVDHPTRLDQLETGEIWISFAVRRIEARYDSLSGPQDQLGRVHIVGVVCRKDAGASLLKSLATFPIPGAAYALSVGQFIAGSVWPDSDSGVDCGQLDGSAPTLYANKRTGRLSVDSFGDFGYLSRAPEHEGFDLVHSVRVNGSQVR